MLREMSRQSSAGGKGSGLAWLASPDGLVERGCCRRPAGKMTDDWATVVTEQVYYKQV